jgi:hypothetical protein
MKCQMKLFIDGCLCGAPSTRDRDLAQARLIYEAIAKRWNLHHPRQWQVKHLRWFLTEHLKSGTSNTRYRYWLTVKKIVNRLQKEADWTPLLKGTWTSPN